MSRNCLCDDNKIYRCLKWYHIFSYLFLQVDLYRNVMLAFWEALYIILSFNEIKLSPLFIWINEMFEMLSTFHLVQTLGQWSILSRVSKLYYKLTLRLLALTYWMKEGEDNDDWGKLPVCQVASKVCCLKQFARSWFHIPEL